MALLTRIVWYRGKAKVDRLLDNTPPGTHITRKSSIFLPHEILEMIIAHLIHDLCALKACSLTCYSWYTAAVPHLHHTITFREHGFGTAHAKLKPLSELHKLGIIPLVAEVRILQLNELCPWFTPQAFSLRDLRYFSAFTNVQKLGLTRMRIYSFIPEVERYFGQFFATLRSIALFAPYCSPRQLSYFLSLFSNLDNIEIRGFPPSTLPFLPTIPDTKLFPISPPKLQGRLMLASFREVETWKDLITSCGGLRFRNMTLRSVANCVSVLFDACSETLETLRVFPADAIQRVPQSLLPDFDLSRLRVLRSLQVEIQPFFLGHNADIQNVIMEVFSTITSPLFSEIVIVLEIRDLPYLLSYIALFETLRTMSRIRPFNLVFCLATDFFQSVPQQQLAAVLKSATAAGLLDFLGSSPTIRNENWRPRI